MGLLGRAAFNTALMRRTAERIPVRRAVAGAVSDLEHYLAQRRGPMRMGSAQMADEWLPYDGGNMALDAGLMAGGGVAGIFALNELARRAQFDDGSEFDAIRSEIEANRALTRRNRRALRAQQNYQGGYVDGLEGESNRLWRDVHDMNDTERR